MDTVGDLRVEKVNNSPAKQTKPKRRSTIQAFLRRQGSKGGDDSLSGTAYEGQNAADILAKQSDMLEQIQHIMIEERWQHEQHSRVLENELQSLHDIIKQHEESESGNKLQSKLTLAFAKGLGPKKAPLAELPFGMPKKPSGDDAIKLAEESRRIANEFKGEARKHLERVKGLEAQVVAEKAEKQRLAEAVTSLEASVKVEKEARKREEDGKAVATDRAQRAVQIARQLEALVKSYAQLPTEPAVKVHVQELHAKLYSIDAELGGMPTTQIGGGGERPNTAPGPVGGARPNTAAIVAAEAAAVFGGGGAKALAQAAAPRGFSRGASESGSAFEELQGGSTASSPGRGLGDQRPLSAGKTVIRRRKSEKTVGQ
mmetsp:Transcript_75096/g.181508  ORF Transcript_75096/g.181508 Transcript_75096/m.181508 type:complete len:372 (+) Transcript_75096:62-1177(+)